MKQDIEINAADGIAKATIFRPDNGASAKCGIIFYMDAMGPRQALFDMAQRLADSGYTVLLPDLFYRFGAYGPFDGTSFGDLASREKIMTMLRGTTQEMTKRDGAAFLDTLTAAGATGPVATVGYCMGGARALTAAAAYSDRITAAASFHGGNLASDAEDSPHLLAADIKGRVYIGVAGVDNSFPPEQSARLAEALRIGGVDHMIENYVGMAHGWTVSDHGVYDQTGAERHWKRLLNLFDEALA
ncbi:dienelactone hydrolase family protein [Rhizobium mayense]|uniref:Dienelactone hydrolase family protein n=1 Tax=Rhizobium mayense TaxID=1312184 RepID=A0ABT7K114_9HYPH|nr:dienelactone hydrolase family protein [Rhizobium mayense]MDL2401837.1 dienelactone hydrolase family protein [Rhizobium mayense]